MDELNALSYLDCVVRESLRMFPPVATTLRAAGRDDVLPVSAPYVDRYGTAREEIRYVARRPVVRRELNLR